MLTMIHKALTAALFGISLMAMLSPAQAQELKHVPGFVMPMAAQPMPLPKTNPPPRAENIRPANLPGFPALGMCLLTHTIATPADLTTNCAVEAREWMKECYTMTELQTLDDKGCALALALMISESENYRSGH